MKIYEIDQAILDVIDLETGEIIDEEAFDALQMERSNKIENLLLWAKDLKAEADAIKAEKNALAERQKVVENKLDSLKQFLMRILAGEKFKTGKVVVSYRKTKSVKVTDEFVDWAKQNADDLLKYAEPTASLTAIKEAIESGRQIEFATIEEKESIQIK